MSLLMDALKKAEEAKRQAVENSAAETASPRPATPEASAEMTLEPVSTPVAAPASGLPKLSQHIDSVDADLAAVSTTAPSRKRQAPPLANPVETGAESKAAAERSAARNVFTAKQAPKSRTSLWLILGLTGVAVAGIGGYFAWQLQSVSGGSLARPAAPMPAPGQSIVNSPIQQTPPAPVVMADARKPEPMVPPPEAAKPQAQDLAPERRERPRAETSAAAPTESDRPIRLSTSRLKQDPTLNRAYDALQADRLDDARRDYEQALRNDAKNTDALLGLATIAVRQGLPDKATELYLRVLEADPKDVNAKAGLINLKGQSDPALSESRLKTLLASQPDSAALNFALGNLHARQSRWNDAQQAYFRAYTAEPDNADHLFNLAVSLDHLHQKSLAIQYYQMALNAAGTRGAAFDKSQVQSRLLELQP